MTFWTGEKSDSPQEQASKLIYLYLTIQTNSRQHHADWNDNMLSLHSDIQDILTHFGMYMRNFANISRGISLQSGEQAEPEQLFKELKDDCRRINTVLSIRYCPPYFSGSHCWTDFCELVATIAQEKPAYGRTRNYKLKPEEAAQYSLNMALATGVKVKLSSWIKRLIGTNSFSIPMPEKTPHLRPIRF